MNNLSLKRVHADLASMDVLIRQKNTSFLMRTLGKFVPGFCERFWTTMPVFFSPERIRVYYPCGMSYHEAVMDEETLAHEAVHCRQITNLTAKYGRYIGGFWFLFSYCFLPVPVLFAWFRWRYEREAYLENIKRGGDVDRVVDVLWGKYGYVWPRRLMLNWFRRSIGK